MNLEQLYQKVNFIAGKDVRGRTLKITELNTLLPSIQDTLYNEELKELLMEDVSGIPASRLSVSPLRVFKYTTAETVDDGSFPLPSDYVRFISVFSNMHEADVVTENEFNKKSSSVFRRPVVRPFCYFTSNDIQFCPTNIGAVQLIYFRKPLVPYFDYCQDADTLNEVFMPVGSVIRQDDANVLCLYDSSSTILKTNVTHSTGVYPYTSKTVELEWEPIFHDKFVLSLLALVGLNIQEVELAKYAEQKGHA